MCRTFLAAADVIVIAVVAFWPPRVVTRVEENRAVVFIAPNKNDLRLAVQLQVPHRLRYTLNQDSSEL